MAKRKKGKTQSTVAGVATGLAAAAADSLVRAAVRRLANDANDTPAAGDDDERAARQKSDKRAKKHKRLKKDKALAQIGKQAQSAGAAGVEHLHELATKARKRLAKLADKLGSVEAKRHALIDELSALQEGIGTVLAQLRTGGDRTVEARPTPKRSRRRKSAPADRPRRSRGHAVPPPDPPPGPGGDGDTDDQ